MTENLWTDTSGEAKRHALSNGWQPLEGVYSRDGSMPAAGSPRRVHSRSSGRSAAPMRKGVSCAFWTKWTQFLTKSIMTLEPKVKWTVVPCGGWGARLALAGALNERYVLAGVIHPGVESTAADGDDGGGESTA